MSVHGSAAAGLVGLLVLASAGAAQTAPELHGRVTETSGAPVAGARIEIQGSAAHAWSDASGYYRLRVDRECDCNIVVSRMGYAQRVLPVALRNGSAVRIDIELLASSMSLAPVHVTVHSADRQRLDRAAIARAGVATAGDLLGTMPGVVVTQTVPAGPQHIMIRGSGAGQVLVVLDGVPINDPVTGTADLARIRADEIESISVLHGARSARYGARALGGVVIIETRRAARPRQVSLSAGSLRAYGGGFTWSDRVGAVPWAAGAHVRGTDGAFHFALDDVPGGVSGTRLNADLLAVDAQAVADVRLAGGSLHLRSSLQTEDRGLPGRAYAPTPRARQSSRLAGVSGAWRSGSDKVERSLLASYARQRIRIVDPQPAFGLPYDDTNRIEELRGEIDLTRVMRDVSVTVRIDGRTLAIDATTLIDPGRAAGELGASAAVQLRPSGSRWFGHLQLRADRNWLHQRSYISHAVTIGRQGAVSAQLSHRSSYAPPSLADQFFRESVGVAANPDLRPERVPGELEGVISWRGAAGETTAELTVTAFIADTRDLIVWEPDYRFVWSPRNTDVRRRGVDVRSGITTGALSLHAWYARSRVTYGQLDRPVQVAYRPRNTAGITVQASRPRWHVGLEGRYTGARNTAPTNLNALPGFWTFAVATSHSASVVGIPTTGSVRIDRIFNDNDSLIFGFPQPRRTLTFELRITDRSGSQKGPS